MFDLFLDQEATMDRSPQFASPIGGLLRMVIDWLNEAASLRELDRCGAQEVEHIARDVGISAGELRALAARRPDRAELLHGRMATLSLDPEELAVREPSVLRDLQRLCSMCDARRRCAVDLRDRPMGPGWQEYCPNSLTLCGLAVSLPAPESFESRVAYLNAVRRFTSASGSVA
jgi:hypothetical protein